MSEQIQFVKECLNTGEFDKGLGLIEELMLKDANNHDKLYLSLYKSRILEMQGNYDQALHIANKLLPELDQNLDINIYLGTIVSISYCYFRLKEFNKLDKILDLGIDLLENYETNTDFEFLDWASAYFNIQGIYFIDKGNINSALIYLQKGKEIREKINNQYELVASYNNLGISYFIKGIFKVSLEYYDKAYELSKKLNAKPKTAMILNNMATIKYYLGEYLEAKTLLKQGLEIRLELGNKVDIGSTYFYLTLTSLAIKEREDAEYYLGKIESLNNEISNKRLMLFFKLGQAIYFKDHNRMKSKAKAQKLLQEIINDKIVDFELTLIAILNLCDLLIDELKLTGEHEVLEEVNQLTNMLYNISYNQGSYWLTTESVILQAKLSLIEGNLENSIKLLNQAEKLSTLHNLVHTNEKVREIKLSLNNEFQKWQMIINEDNEIGSKMRYEFIKEYLGDISRSFAYKK